MGTRSRRHRKAASQGTCTRRGVGRVTSPWRGSPFPCPAPDRKQVPESWSQAPSPTAPRGGTGCGPACARDRWSANGEGLVLRTGRGRDDTSRPGGHGHTPPRAELQAEPELVPSPSPEGETPAGNTDRGREGAHQGCCRAGWRRGGPGQRPRGLGRGAFTPADGPWHTQVSLMTRSPSCGPSL